MQSAKLGKKTNTLKPQNLIHNNNFTYDTDCNLPLIMHTIRYAVKFVRGHFTSTFLQIFSCLSFIYANGVFCGLWVNVCRVKDTFFAIKVSASLEQLSAFIPGNMMELLEIRIITEKYLFTVPICQFSIWKETVWHLGECLKGNVMVRWKKGRT